MLYNNLIRIKKDLYEHKRDPKSLTYYYINKRLNASLSSYYKQLTTSVSYLDNRKPENVIKEL